MPPESDVIRVRHMLESARSAISFAAGRSRADLDGDPMLVHAYHDVDLNVVWDTVDIDLPPLVATLEAWLKAEE